MKDRDFDAGREAGQRWIHGPAFEQLSEEQIHALPQNLDRSMNNRGDLIHQDENADPAADAYAALTGDLDCHSRETVRAFWARALPDNDGSEDETFYLGFLMGVSDEVGHY